MNDTAWLTEVETTLANLEKVNPTDTSKAGFAVVAMATQKLADLGARLRRMSDAERRTLGPRMPALQGRIDSVLTKLGQAKNAASGQMKTLQHHGKALNAYLVSDHKK